MPIAGRDDFGLINQGGLDIGQVAFLFGVTDLGEDLLLLGVALVLEGDHLVGGAEFRVPPAAGPGELGHPDRSVISALLGGAPEATAGSEGVNGREGGLEGCVR